MGYKSWSEEVTDTIEVAGKQVQVKRTVEYYSITCDYCGEVIIDTSKGVLGNAYVKVGDKYYHPDCYEAVQG